MHKMYCTYTFSQCIVHDQVIWSANIWSHACNVLYMTKSYGQQAPLCHLESSRNNTFRKILKGHLFILNLFG